MKFISSNFEIHLSTGTQIAMIGVDHPFYLDICRALKAGDDSEVNRLLDVPGAIVERFNKVGLGTATINTETEVVSIDGIPISGRVLELITNFKKLHIPYTALLNFWKKLQKNPTHVGKDSMIRFLEHNNVPILPNGNFLAYKGVIKTDKPNVFHSVQDSSFLYKFGVVAELPRDQCTVDIGNCCGPGLHVGGFSHASGYGDTIIDIEVDPADVVSVPTAEDSKCRACKVLPVRVNIDRKCYEEAYIDLQKMEAVGDVSAHEHPPTDKIYKNESALKPKRKNKTTWYQQQGNRILIKRAVKKPGLGWNSQKPATSKNKANRAFKLKGAAQDRTWYSYGRNGEIKRVRASIKPGPTWSSHKSK